LKAGLSEVKRVGMKVFSKVDLKGRLTGLMLESEKVEKKDYKMEE
jgi:hypothetical protein